MGLASSGNWLARSPRTSWMRVTAAECTSMPKFWSRKTVSPSFRESWNQSRQVTRSPVQLWKYSWATTRSMFWKSPSVAVSGRASTYLVLKMFRPLFSMAPMLKSPTATIMKVSRSISRPKTSSSHAMLFFRAAMACAHWSSRPGST